MQYKPNMPRDSFPERSDPDDSPLGIVELWLMLWRNKLRILAPAIVLTVLASLMVLRSDDIYTAEAQMLLSRDNLEIVEFDSSGGSEATQGEISNALTILGSRSLALQVIDRLDLTNDPEINPNLSQPADTDPAELYDESIIRQFALDWLASVTQMNILPGTNVILIRATTTTPGKSAVVANAYVDAYLEYQLRRSQSETERAADALETRVRQLRLQLEEDQARLQNFRAGAENSITESATSLAGEAANIRGRLRSTQEQITRVDAARETLSAAGRNAESLRAAIDQNTLLSRLEQPTLGRALATASAASDAAALGRALQVEQDRLERLRDALRTGLDAIETRITDANAFTVGLRQLEVEVETTSQVYEGALARLKELAMQTGLRDAGAQILARAEAPLRPAAQGRRRAVAIAAVLGLLLGVAYVLIREAANNRVRKVAELIEITASDRVIQLPAGKRSSSGKSAPLSEGIRTVRHRLMTDAPEAQGPIVAGVFSPLPSTDRALVAQELAHSFSMIEKRVIVIDGDMRVGTLSRLLDVPEDHPGLQEVLADNVDPETAIMSFNSIGFDLLPSGGTRENPADLLVSKRLPELVAALRDRYDVLIFDTPPVLLLSDAANIASQMNTHVLVVEYDRTPRTAVREAFVALQGHNPARPIITFCNAPEAFGQNYVAAGHSHHKYWA